MDSDLRQLIAQYLAEHNTLTLATYGPDGPAGAGLFYVSDDRFRLYFLSDPKARHVANLAHDPQVAATIHEDYHDWREIQGIQVRGKAHAVESAIDRARAMQLYIQKYPFTRDFITNPKGAGEILAHKIVQSKFHVIIPHWMRWIDNRAGFGSRREYDSLSDMEIPLER